MMQTITFKNWTLTGLDNIFGLNQLRFNAPQHPITINATERFKDGF
jgi:hypothetical protein